jgi:hypothetical protein
VIWDPDLGGDMGPTFRTPILELMPNVISKIKQNSSDMNEIILSPSDVTSKIKQNSSDINEIILAPCDAGYVQSCTGFYQNCNTRNWRYPPKGVFWCFLDPLEAGNRTTVSKKVSKI